MAIRKLPGRGIESISQSVTISASNLTLDLNSTNTFRTNLTSSITNLVFSNPPA